MFKRFLCAMVFALSAGATQAAELEYDFSAAPLLGGTLPGEIRATFLEVLSPVRITALAADLAQISGGASQIDATWTIYASNANDDVLGAVGSADASFDFANFSAGVARVRTAIDLHLDAGFYLFALQTGQSLLYSNYDEREIASELPFLTDDGAIRVLDGGILNFASSDPSIISGNVRLPALAVTYETPAPVPLPASGILLLAGVGAVALTRRRIRTPAC